MRLRRSHALMGLMGLMGLLAVSASACSTVDRGPIDECREDVDCGSGQVCSQTQGNICVPEVLPPQTALGFDIKDGEGLRVELFGCDPEVELELGGSDLRVEKRGSLVRNYQLGASESRTITSCDECDDICDETALTCTAPTEATLTLSSLSRLGIVIFERNQDFLVPPDLPEDQLPTPVGFSWPLYDSILDPTANATLSLTVSPLNEAPQPRWTYRRMLASDAPEVIDSVALDRCQRAIIGPEGTVRTFALEPTSISDAKVEFTYAESIASPSTVFGTAATCIESSDCPPGWACNEGGTCGLDLLGVAAGSATSLADPPGALPPAHIYTYCEDGAEGEALVRNFSVRVTPPESSGLPTMTYNLAQTFPYPPAPGTLTEINLEDDSGPDLLNFLCLPEWQPPIPVAFSVTGKPVTLTETEQGVYTCCSTGCLPSPDPGVEPTPPSQIDTCTDTFASASFETRWSIPNLQDWTFAGCIPTGAAESDGSSGKFVRSVKCEEGGCSVMLTSGEIDELSRSYRVSIEQATDSVFRSQRFNVAVTAETDMVEFELEPRVLFRGQVVCDSNATDCSAINAVVKAVRLRADTDDSDPIGPFEFDTRVSATGNFVMPIDPGLYVITAYPDVGAAGGPARYEVIDLREDSPLLDDIGGVPHATLAEPLELDDGVSVRVQLRDFPVSTRLTPYDTGSWKHQNGFPADLDLNDPASCLGSSIGCSIRQLRPIATPLSLLLSGEVQFTTRDRGGQCGD